MKIYVENENQRKIVYDILNIFYDKEDFSFVEKNPDILIKNGLIASKNKSYFFDSNLKLKQILFEILEKESKKTSDWGILTGSKPSKLLKNHSLEDLKNIYKLKDNKINLLKDIKESQDKLKFDAKDFNLYINIPFCPQRCRYCSYPTIVSNTVEKNLYVDFLLEEISKINLPKKLDTIYLGGGTPSNLSVKDLDRILSLINEKFIFNEFTLEAGREDTLDFEKLVLFKEKNVGRISLNPQTFTSNILENINRPINFYNFVKIYDYAKKLGFIVNMDFIVGLYGENRESFSKNFEILKKLKPDNITFHALAQKVGSKYFEENINGNESESIKIAKDIEIFTKENSYNPYYLYRQKNIIGNLENIGYEKENTSQRYNILINEELENIIGLGMNANSKLMNGKKYRNERNLRDYYKNIEKEIYDKNKLIENFINKPIH
ncbi:MAG: radical SAM protein [Anaerococcus vaginalis]|uniref:radical SAM protein n=1 Tax=Anaerococcus vaginalis TaxID=33037 RepID=UPI00290BCB10|nr:radical SAM protein [Anaerococcus vaginalis]MDU7433235.1 radical SAM protein [Anaerococcus vaginalis]